MTAQMNERTKVFISYSHRDANWLERLRVHLRPLEREYKIDIWDDTKIRAGSRWREEIKKALETAKVAVLLISADFLASDFIATDELPPLLSAVEKEGAIILPVILSPSRFSKNPHLSIFQAVNDPSSPLINLTRGEQEAILVRVVDSIEASLKEQLQNNRTKARRIKVECSDVVDFDCDVLVLKYAQAFYGADSVVADRLIGDYKQRSHITPSPGEYMISASQGEIAARHILFVGVVEVYEFEYKQIREFATRSMQILAQEMPTAVHVAMTMHGVGYGLDERESFSSQLAGLLDAFRNEDVSTSLEQISIIERNQSRAERLPSRIHFCTYKSLDLFLTNYDNLHKCNYRHFRLLVNCFYKDVFTDYRKNDLFKKEFELKVLDQLNVYAGIYRRKHNNQNNDKLIDNIMFGFESDSDVLLVGVGCEPEVVDYFNNSSYLFSKIGEALKDIYKYEGKYKMSVDDGIPW